MVFAATAYARRSSRNLDNLSFLVVFYKVEQQQRTTAKTPSATNPIPSEPSGSENGAERGGDMAAAVDVAGRRQPPFSDVAPVLSARPE